MCIYGERVEYRLKNKSFPDAAVIREGVQNMQMHLDYISWLVDQRNWLAGHYLTLADITAAAQLSTLDYLGMFLGTSTLLQKNGMRAHKSLVPAFMGCFQIVSQGIVAWIIIQFRFLKDFFCSENICKYSLYF